MDQCRYNARRSLVQLRQGKIVKSMSVAGAGVYLEKTCGVWQSQIGSTLLKSN